MCTIHAKIPCQYLRALSGMVELFQGPEQFRVVPLTSSEFTLKLLTNLDASSQSIPRADMLASGPGLISPHTSTPGWTNAAHSQTAVPTKTSSQVSRCTQDGHTLLEL